METTIRVCVIERENGYRSALEAVISTAGGMECVASASTADEAIQALKAAVKPDVVLLGKSRGSMLRKLEALSPGTPVVVLSERADAQHILQALSGGALGYLLKSSSWNEICKAVREVHRGGMPLSSEIRPLLLKLVRSAQDSEPVEKLSDREQQVLELLRNGSRNKEIAVTLNLGVPTVRTHLRTAYLKLRVHSRSEAIEKLNGPELSPSGAGRAGKNPLAWLINGAMRPNGSSRNGARP